MKTEALLFTGERGLLARRTQMCGVCRKRTNGFADMDADGYLDRLYVHKDYQGRGVAAALCDALEQAVQCEAYTTHASITARPFFEKRGYRVVRAQQVERQGLYLTNYVMEKRRGGGK